MRACWCGNTRLRPFSPGYRECDACGTLVSVRDVTPEDFIVRDDEKDYYGKKYWLEHQEQTLGFTDIHQRARADLAERNLHWLPTLMRYRLPPARALEIGCAHGSFVALMKHAGYEASGVEMSPWVVQFARETFGVPVMLGPVERVDIKPASLDVLVLMDVLEHLADPVATMSHGARLLRPDGVALIQTPCYRPGTDFATLERTKDRFLEMLIPDEHIYLFSEASVRKLLAVAGLPNVAFEPALFSHYDMFLAASPAKLHAHAKANADDALLARPEGRLVAALLDVRAREVQFAQRLSEAEADRRARGEQVERLTAMVEESDQDRRARGEQIAQLTAQLAESDADRQARAEQIEKLGALLRESEADRLDRAGQIDRLSVMLAESEEDRLARAAQIGTLDRLLRESEADRRDRAAQIEKLRALVHESDAERSVAAERLRRLGDQLAESENDRAARGRQVDALNSMLAESESDRLARARQIEKLGALLAESEDDRRARAEQIVKLGALLAESEGDRRARLDQLEKAGAMLAESEADRAARAEQIEKLTAELERSEQERKALLDRSERLREELESLYERRLFRALRKVTHWPEVSKVEKELRPPK